MKHFMFALYAAICFIGVPTCNAIVNVRTNRNPSPNYTAEAGTITHLTDGSKAWGNYIVQLHQDVALCAPVFVTGHCVINGDNHSITLENNIYVSPGSTLEFKNCRITGTPNARVILQQPDSDIILDNCPNEEEFLSELQSGDDLEVIRETYKD